MSVQRTLSLIALATCVALPVAAGADPAATPTKALFQKLYDKADAAADKKDADGVVAIYSVNVVAQEKDGTSKTYSDLLQGAQQLFTLAQSVSSRTTVTSCKVDGNTALILQTDVTKLSVANPTGGPGYVLVDTSVTRDGWRKTDEGWKIVKENAISDDMTEDGKPVSSLLGGQMPSGE